MIRYCWRIGTVEWRIPAKCREEADRLLCWILGVAQMPREARYLGEM